MAKEYIKKLQENIEQLEDTVDSKNIELRVLENEMMDVMLPSMVGTKITSTVCEMIGELLEFEKRKGRSEKSEASKARLIGLLNDTEQLNSLSTKLNTLKLTNKFLFTHYQIQRVENLKLKQQLKKIEDAEQY